MAKRLTKGRNVALVAVAALAPAAATAFLYFKPAPSTSVDKPEDPCPAKGLECRGKPRGGCVADEGKRDPTSKSFKASGCTAFCGDGVKQDGETAGNCPLDVHCGDGKRQLDESRVYMKVGSDDKKVVTYTKRIRECSKGTETYCEADCKR